MKFTYIRWLGLYRTGDRYLMSGVDDRTIGKLVLRQIPWIIRWMYSIEIVEIETDYTERAMRIQLDALKTGRLVMDTKKEVVN